MVVGIPLRKIREVHESVSKNGVEHSLCVHLDQHPGSVVSALIRPSAILSAVSFAKFF